MRLSAALRNACRNLPVGPGHVPRHGSCLVGVRRTSTPLPFGSHRALARDASTGSGQTSEAAVKLRKQRDGSVSEHAIREVIQQSRQELVQLCRENTAITPVLAIIQAAEDDRLLEINKKMAAKVGLSIMDISLPGSCTEEEVLEEVLRLNEDAAVRGIYLHLPPSRITPRLLSSLAPHKDVDGVCDVNVGRMVRGDLSQSFTTPQARAVMELLTRHDACLEGKTAVMVGGEGPLGAVLQCLMEKAGMALLRCHPDTAALQKQVGGADAVVVLGGAPSPLLAGWLKPGAALISCSPSLTEPCAGAESLAVSSWTEVAQLSAAFRMQNVVQSCGMWAECQRYQPWRLRPLKLQPLSPVPSDLSISRAQTPKPIGQLAQEIGLLPEELELYGRSKAKVRLSLLQRLQEQPNGKYVIVAGITPTPLGEGKSTVTLGLVQALSAHLQLNSFACLRQPSQGPTFGVKGGAAGGGYAQVIPMEEFNLHLTGDIHAITAANNLLAAAVDARILHEAAQSDKALYNRLVPSVNGVRRFSPIQLSRLQRLGIKHSDPAALSPEDVRRFVRLDLDPEKVTWQRVLDTNDRFLRRISVGQAPTEKGHVRQAQFDIAVASEIMAILALADDLTDMRRRLGSMVVGSNRSGQPVTADDLGVMGALTVLMKDAIKPTLMQTLEGTPVFVHAGPFANIAHGNSSVLADKLALKLVGEDGYVGECVHTHTQTHTHTHTHTHLQSLQLVASGCSNLKKQIQIAQLFGVPVVVALTSSTLPLLLHLFVFYITTDSQAELDLVCSIAKDCGAAAAVPCHHWSRGGRGSLELANAVKDAAAQQSSFHFLYDLQMPIEEKIRVIAQRVYGADDVELTPKARAQVDYYTQQGYGSLPICMAKTHLSLSHMPERKGVPTGFTLPITDVRASIGAGFIYPLVGTMSTMPGLPTRPCFYDIDIDPITEEITGLF
ncbi:monofunctional C1-tetrahydrofolate synthase, mitochondrial [Alosa sapidissima]|uniref:monofunctional C1-tetrahydrofolate synthase, mitochondrial n=1 Tax=Alosa sapidissima TaxID=34773 RepID=UPI001C0842CE|nr:monofunctional C1-tetrahydrofolate synthase, mitochondrial [Alosa sapidissima]